METEFRFISLGGDCQPGHHSRRILQQQDIPFVFDWLMTPVAAVEELIASEFADFFRTENLIWEQRDGYWSVTDGRHGVVSHHHFKAGPPEPIRQVHLTFRGYAQRFVKVLRRNRPVIYVRRWIKEDGDQREAAAMRVYHRLRAYRPDCVLLYLQPHDPSPPQIEGGFIRAYNPSSETSTNWEGYIPIYQRNFARAARLATAIATRVPELTAHA